MTKAVNLGTEAAAPSDFLEELEVEEEEPEVEELEPVEEEVSDFVPEEKVSSLAPEQDSLPSTVNLFALVKEEQDKSPVEVKLKAPETRFKASKVTLLKAPSIVADPPTVFNLERPSKDSNFRLSLTTRAPPTEVTCGRETSSKLSLPSMVKEPPMFVNFRMEILSNEVVSKVTASLTEVRLATLKELIDSK